MKKANSRISGLAVVTAVLMGLGLISTALAQGTSPASPAGMDVARANGPSNPGAKSAGPTDTEMARLVAALEERIRQLEEKIATLSTSPAPIPAPASAPVSDAAAAVAKVEQEVATIKEEAKQNSHLLKFLRDIELTGVVDGYYSYNTNQIDMFTQGRAFDVRHNAFSLQLARLGLYKANSIDNPLGFRLDVGLGETIDRIISVSDANRNEATKHVLQAYVSYVAPVGKGLTVDFGKMYTPIGAEVVDTKDNFNYSRGWLFAYGPYYHMGFRAKYAVNDKVAVTGFLFDGWDNMFENNRSTGAGKTIGFQLGLNPTKKLALTQTYLGGPEAPLANLPAESHRDNWRHIADTVATYLVNDKLTLMGNFVAGSDGDDDGRRGSWVGAAAFLKYAFNQRFAFSPRFEVFHDDHGLRTGTAQTIKGLTLTQEMKLVNNLLTRFEYRRDFSNRDFFSNHAGNTLKHQNTFLVGISYSFSNREP